METNRVLKFRAFVKTDIGGFMIPNQDTDCFMVSNGDGFTIYDEYKRNIPENRISLMQYTGLKDKKGKEVYEGDMIRYKNDKGFSIIKYEKGSFFFYGISVIFFLFNLKEEDIEVIGNIYENPELT